MTTILLVSLIQVPQSLKWSDVRIIYPVVVEPRLIQVPQSIKCSHVRTSYPVVMEPRLIQIPQSNRRHSQSIKFGAGRGDCVKRDVQHGRRQDPNDHYSEDHCIFGRRSQRWGYLYCFTFWRLFVERDHMA